jgi:glycosyltransferase involved in cell wall biosynthesis
MIRIAHVIPSLGVGGAEQMVLDLCRRRNAAEFASVVVAPKEGPMAGEIRRSGTPVFTGPGSYSAVAQWADLINLHWWRYDPALLRLIRSLRRPFVTTLHSAVVLPDLPVVTICTSDYAYQVQKHRSRCFVIPNGVDLARFAPRPRQPRKGIVLTRICRPPRCAFYFWEAMARVIDDHAETQLWIVGHPASERRTSDRVRFLGVRRDIPEILAATDIFVYAPYPGEGSLDVAAVEAAAAGVPSVVSDVNSVCTVVEQDRNGFRTPFGDVGEFAEKVGMLVRDGELRARMSAAAVQIARERFDVRAVARRYEAVYRAVLQAHRSH